jgi:hypothetical protein
VNKSEKIIKETIIGSSKGKYTMVAPCKDPRLILELLITVADPHHFNAAPDLAPAFHFNVRIRIRLFI